MLYEIGYRPTKQREVYDAQYFWTVRKTCLEAHIRTVSPWGEDFDTAMQELFEVREELAALERCLTQIQEKQSILILNRRTPEECTKGLHEVEKEVKDGTD